MHKKLLNSNITIGAQPSSDDLKQLKIEGIRSVINLRMPDEPSPLNPQQEAEAVRSLGMEYAHIPVSSQNLNPAQADEFSEKLRSLPKPVFVHCQGGTRAGAFSLMHLGKEAHWTAEQAFAEGEKAGFKCESAALREYVISILNNPAK